MNMLENYANYFNKQTGRNLSCSNQVITCIYITKYKQEVFDYLNQKNITPILIRKNLIKWQENNEIWMWCPISESSRGKRFYKVKISKNYNDYEILEKIIIPCCSLYCCSWEVI